MLGAEVLPGTGDVPALTPNDLLSVPQIANWLTVAPKIANGRFRLGVTAATVALK